MIRLTVRLFGNLEIALVRAGTSTPVMATHRVQALLAYLVLHRERHHPRDVLMAEFWPDFDETRARNALNTALWRLRTAIEPEGVPAGTFVTTTPTGEVGFNTGSDFWLDVAAFEAEAGSFLTGPAEACEVTDAEALEQALGLYTGDLLDGFYADWALRERERLRLLYLKCMAALLAWYDDHAQYEHALACGEQILGHDPLREEIHREMMRLYVKTGRRPLAVQQYRALREVLAQELGIAPMTSTQLLYRQIVAAESAADPLPQAGDNPPLLRRALEQLAYATETLTAAQEELRRVALLVERLSGGSE